jgi:hypothetical protein
MLKQERITCKNGVEQIHTYSDEGFYILQKETGIKYTEAYDNIPVKYNYVEITQEQYDELNKQEDTKDE